MATNSSEWKVYNLDTMNCQLLEGHTDIVLSLEVNDRGDMLVTGSKVLYPYNIFFYTYYSIVKLCLFHYLFIYDDDDDENYG